MANAFISRGGGGQSATTFYTPVTQNLQYQWDCTSSLIIPDENDNTKFIWKDNINNEDFVIYNENPLIQSKPLSLQQARGYHNHKELDNYTFFLVASSNSNLAEKDGYVKILTSYCYSRSEGQIAEITLNQKAAYLQDVNFLGYDSDYNIIRRTIELTDNQIIVIAYTRGLNNKVRFYINGILIDATVSNLSNERADFLSLNERGSELTNYISVTNKTDDFPWTLYEIDIFNDRLGYKNIQQHSYHLLEKHMKKTQSIE